MIELRDVSAVRGWRAGVAGTVGFVPTMGALHAGHISLVERAVEENPHVIASIFVNPTQFAANEDLATYPRDLAGDIAKLESSGCEAVYVPHAAAVYPPAFQTWVTAEHVAAPLEGVRRPTHFRGVCTIVLKLFHAVQPDRAYFGQKDAQQLAVIQQMVRDLDVPVVVRPCPTIREADGLAMSSRNAYLTPPQRAAATALYRALQKAHDLFASGERHGARLKTAMSATLGAEPLVEEDYVSVADPDTMAELERVTDRAVFAIAARVGATRLIDNILVETVDTTGEL